MLGWVDCWCCYRLPRFLRFYGGVPKGVRLFSLISLQIWPAELSSYVASAIDNCGMANGDKDDEVSRDRYRVYTLDSLFQALDGMHAQLTR